MLTPSYMRIDLVKISAKKHSKLHSSPTRLSTRALTSFVLASMLPSVSFATESDTIQMSPLGFSGAINTPTADVMPKGSAWFSLTNNNPDTSPIKPRSTPFGSVNLGFGIFPGLEITGRLFFHGDLQCNSFIATCSARRDLSMNAKYQLPLSLPLNTRLAVGMNDVGGAGPATFFSQKYAVSTSSLGPVDISIGYSKPQQNNTIMDGRYRIQPTNGFFGNLTARVTERLAVTAESGVKAHTIGAHYTYPASTDTDLQLGISHRLSGPATEATNQITATFKYFFDKKIQIKNNLARFASENQNSESTNEPIIQTLDIRGKNLFERLTKNGFTNIQIKYLPPSEGKPPLWWIQAEPVGWRKNSQDALGVGLAQWMIGNESEDSEIFFNLTYMSQPTTSVYTNQNCLRGFAYGNDICDKTYALRFLNGSKLPERILEKNQDKILTIIDSTSSFTWKPQVEVGVSLRSTVGTELGLADYSAALNLGGQIQLDIPDASVQLSKGWMWQGNVLIPVSRSEDFEKNKSFYPLAHQKTELDQALLSYWRYVDTPWIKNIAVQGSVGSVNPYSRGAQVDAVWMNEEGNLRVGATVGAYSRRKASGISTTQTPALFSMRQSVIPGQWHLEGTFGKFLAGDTGYKIASHHWYGDYKLSFFIRETKGEATVMPKTRFAGFEISLPFGPKESAKSDIGTIRGQDRWGWGLNTKIGQRVNTLSYGYGETPLPRHGVWTDVIDYDRSGPVDMWSRKDSLREALQSASQ